MPLHEGSFRTAGAIRFPPPPSDTFERPTRSHNKARILPFLNVSVSSRLHIDAFDHMLKQSRRKNAGLNFRPTTRARRSTPDSLSSRCRQTTRISLMWTASLEQNRRDKPTNKTDRAQNWRHLAGFGGIRHAPTGVTAKENGAARCPSHETPTQPPLPCLDSHATLLRVRIKEGIGQKSPDTSAIPLCAKHHRTGNASYHQLAPRKILWE